MLLFWVHPRPRPPPALSSLVFFIRSLARCALDDKENRPPLTRTKGYALQVLGVVEVLVVDNLQRHGLELGKQFLDVACKQDRERTRRHEIFSLTE